MNAGHSAPSLEQHRAALARRIPQWPRPTIGDWFDRLIAEFAEREHVALLFPTVPELAFLQLAVAKINGGRGSDRR